MDKFGSYLELMVAFNFAYVLAQDFFKDLMIRALGLSKSIESKSSEMSSFISRTKESIDRTMLLDGMEKSLKSTASKKLGDILSELDNIKVQFKNELNKLAGPIGFSELCFITGLVLTSILLLEGYTQNQMISSMYFSFIIRNLLIGYCVSYILIVCCNFFNTTSQKIKYHLYGNAYSLGLFVASFLISIIACKMKCDPLCDEGKCLNQYKLNDMSFHVISILPWIHFGFYLFKAIFKSRKSLGEINNQIKKVEERKENAITKDPYIVGFLNPIADLGIDPPNNNSMQQNGIVKSTNSEDLISAINLESLVKMYDKGLLSDEEFQSLKDKAQ